MFKSKNPNGTHDYLVYKDKNTGQVRAIELTHLYIPDKKRFWQVKQKHIKKMKLPHRETPSGVDKRYFVKNINGKAIDLKHPDVNLNVYRKARISLKQQENILKFAKYQHK